MKTVRFLAFIILTVVDKRSGGVSSLYQVWGLCLRGCHLGAPQTLIAELM